MTPQSLTGCSKSGIVHSLHYVHYILITYFVRGRITVRKADLIDWFGFDQTSKAAAVHSTQTEQPRPN